MINHSQANIEELWIHYIGNAAKEEGVQYCKQSIATHNKGIHKLLKQYFFDNFKEPEFYTFDFFDGNIDLNPVYNYAKIVFNDPEVLGEQSINIVKYLYENSKHPNIKSGDVFVSYVKDVLVDDELIDALCIFKSENKQAFLNIEKQGQTYKVNEGEGINAGKIDKACIIFNTDESEGFKICALDHSNKSKEAQFWNEKFLNIKARSDDYHHTKHYIQATKAFITERLRPLHDIDKTQEAEILNRSFEYLKNEEKLAQSDFDETIFKDPNVINEFQLFKLDYQQEKSIDLQDNFNLNPAALKNQANVFKSVLKLDKNFHIYIHGNRNMIEKGMDEMGRKYYKIFYEEEN